jgi:hypothetical protein
MRFSVGFQPEDFHPLLHAWIGVVKSLLADRLQFVIRELEAAHPCVSAIPGERTLAHLCADISQKLPLPAIPIVPSLGGRRIIGS